MDYKEAVEYINSSRWFGTDNVMQRMAELLERLGNPQRALRFIHIAGTNGKGSCAAMTASVLKAAGYKTGLFTSPCLSRFNERIQINGKQTDDDALTELIAQVRAAADAMDEHPTAFDMATAAAMLRFAQEKCDLAVMEAGLGGRIDSTNIIEAPEAAIIMNIGLDHTEYLGSTPEKIAEEKAGIIKPGCDCVLYPQSGSVMDVIRGRCGELGARLHMPDFSQIERGFDSLFGQSFSYMGENYALPLLGETQLKNAAVVLETVDVLRARGWKLEQGDVEHGLYAVSWPGRFELVHDEPCFIVDGAHNVQCAQTVRDNLEHYFPGVRRIMLIGMLKDKDRKGMLDILAPAADSFICITPDSPRALPAEKLAEELARFGKPVTVCAEIREGVERALAAAEGGGMVCAAGSLHSVGEIRACFELY